MNVNKNRQYKPATGLLVLPPFMNYELTRYRQGSI
jgi:hypothetical protein